MRDWEDADKSPKNLPAHATAAHSELEGDFVKMDGGAVVTQGNTKLSADRADMKRSTNEVNLYGNVVLQQPHTKISGSNADMTTTNSFGHVADARLLDYQTGMRVTADKLTRRKEDVIELDGATYTSCPPDAEDWRLSAKHIRLNQDTGRGEATNTVIRVKDVPVFYSPYMNFPIDDRRQSGFLWPMIGSSSSGIDAALPYYFNLAPNYDATLTPRQITDRGTMVEAEGRYLGRSSNWLLSGADLQGDNKTGDDRWFFGAQESGNLNSYFSTNIDYSRVSDNNYFHDFSINSLNIKRQTSLNESASINMNYVNWFASLQVQQYQIIDELVAEPYKKMPQFTFGRSASGENFKLDYSITTEMTRFAHNDANSALDPGGPWITGDRLYVEPGISFPMRWSASFFNPEVRMRYVGYNLDRPDAQPGENHPQTAVPEAILDSGLFFERNVNFGENAFQQTLEPRLYYLYSPYQKQIDQPLFDTSPLTFDYQQLFQPRRLVGHDRLEDFNQLASGVTSRLIEDASGRELGHASVGQIFYFGSRKVDASTVESTDKQAKSAIAGQLTLQPTESFWANSNVLWDQSNNRVEQGNFYVHYDASNSGIYNLGYRYNQSDTTVSTLANGLRQADASAAIPLNAHWRFLARVNYDLDLHTTLEDMVGIEYEDCCWVTRLVYQRALFGEELNTIGQPIPQRDQTILVEFQLKGLGGLGRKVNKLLEESIWGYRDRY
ncbi:MAG: hypothetical protein JWM78_313 [Verrucomicrobiaceae bacterium]|nr:hypothetical protein [Verrucomicrobiaceae bacterium]